MENYSSMADLITQTKIYPNIKTPSFRGNGDSSFNLDAHTSSNMKVERPKITVAEFSNQPLKINSKFSIKDANKKLNNINEDIAVNARNEKSKHEFDTKRYFTFFGIIALLTAAFAYFRRGK